MIGIKASGFRSLQALSVIGSAYSTTSTITVPAGALAGDIIVFFNVVSNSTSTPPTSAVPSGFTSINESQPVGQGYRGVLSYIRSVSNLAGTSLTGMTGTSAYENVVLVVRSTLSAPISITSANSEGTADVPTSQSIISSVIRDPAIALAFYRNNFATTTRTFSPSEDGSSDGQNSQAKWKIYNGGNGADITTGLNDGGLINLLHSACLSESDSKLSAVFS